MQFAFIFHHKCHARVGRDHGPMFLISSDLTILSLKIRCPQNSFPPSRLFFPVLEVSSGFEKWSDGVFE